MTSTEHDLSFQSSSRAIIIFGFAFTVLITALPTLGVLFPRSLAYAPPAIGLFGFLAFRPVFGHWPKIAKPYFFWAGGFLLLITISGFWSISPDIAQERALKFLPIILGGGLLFTLCRALPTPILQSICRWFPYGLVVSGLFLCADLYGDGLIYRIFHETEPHEVDLNLSRLNRSVAIFVLCLLPALYMTLSNGYHRHKLRAFIAVLGVLYGLILLKTDSQSVQLASIFVVIFYVLVRLRPPLMWCGFRLSLVLLVLVTPWMTQILFHSLSSALHEWSFFQNGYAASRLEIWDFVSRRALEQPLWGHGVEATRVFQDFETQKLYHPDSFVLHPHNFAVQVWIEFGALGALFMAGFLTFMISLIQKMPTALISVCLPFFFAILFMASTTYGLWQGWWQGLFSLLFALCALIYGLYKSCDDV